MTATAPPKSKAEVEKYASTHQLEARLSAAVNAAIAADSPDPLAYMQMGVGAEEVPSLAAPRP